MPEQQHCPICETPIAVALGGEEVCSGCGATVRLAAVLFISKSPPRKEETPRPK